MSNRFWLVCALSTLAASAALAVPSLVDRVRDDVYVVRDDNGAWGGLSNGITHMNRGDYTARKILDLSDLPADVWERAKAIRLSVYFMVRDYSWHDLPQRNGLNESFDLVINGKVHTYPDSGGFPVYVENSGQGSAWHDFALPREEFVRGPNEILIRKSADSKGDDYLYLGIDNSLKRGNSAVAFDGKTWTQDKLTIPGGNGEYMVRLYVLLGDTKFTVRYAPGTAQPLTDDTHLLRYVGAHGAEKTAAGVVLQPGQALRLEWSPQAVDTGEPLAASATVEGKAEVGWLDEADTAKNVVPGEGEVKLADPARLRTSGLVVRATTAPVTVKQVALSGSRSYHPEPPAVNLCPAIAPPACGAKLPAKPPTCKLTVAEAVLDNGLLRAKFARGARLRLTSLYNAVTKTEMVREPDAVSLFMVEVADKRYTGNRDFRLQSLTPTKGGFTAELVLPEPALRATLTVGMEGEGLRLGMKLANFGAAPVDFKLSFPHLAGLAVSEKLAQDYYYYPWGGGIFSDLPVIIRRGYGDHEALYQVMDLYSPARGGGLYLRIDDNAGWHKILSLRKHVPGQMEASGDALVGVNLRVKPEYRFDKPLEAVAGTGLSTEYLRRTRAPGGSFAPADAVLCAHAGDWHTAIKAYSAWAHRVWKWRPYPSRLKSVRNMIAAGWGTGILFKDGKYRTDIIKDPEPGVGHTQTDCIELMSWWDWSPLGPFMTPLDQVAEKFGAGVYNTWKGYYVKDPVTGQLMWNNQPGDYAGYNDRFGGLPAFRAAVQTYQRMGALTTLYTDPFRLDENCPTGKAHGKEWCVIDNNDQLSTGYEVFNPCHDLPEVRQWVAQTMGRVMRETGADGIRLDEYGHRGWACYNPAHHHTYAEPGITQWQKAVAETTRMVHEEMDKVRPGLVLTTEHPGYDYLMQYLDGCITYDFTVMATPLRPLECNLQRFSFPECKAYELDHRSADPGDKKKFWNAVESFGRYYPLPFYTILSENEAAYQGRDCTPLLWTAGNAPQIYVNRFAAGDKRLYHLYNAAGYSYEGVALSVKLAPDQHLFDLLRGEELAPVELPGKTEVYVPVYLPRNDVGCVGQFTRRLGEISGGEGSLTVEVSKLPGVCRLAVTDREGRILLAQAAKVGTNTLDLTKLTVEGKPACVKLFAGRELVDVTAVP